MSIDLERCLFFDNRPESRANADASQIDGKYDGKNRRVGVRLYVDQRLIILVDDRVGE